MMAPSAPRNPIWERAMVSLRALASHAIRIAASFSQSRRCGVEGARKPIVRSRVSSLSKSGPVPVTFSGVVLTPRARREDSSGGR